MRLSRAVEGFWVTKGVGSGVVQQLTTWGVAIEAE